MARYDDMAPPRAPAPLPKRARAHVGHSGGRMNHTAPGEPQQGARSEASWLRFLRWLIEPPAEHQPEKLRVLRWLLRAVGFVLYAAVVGPDDGPGMGGGHGRKHPAGEPAEPRA